MYRAYPYANMSDLNLDWVLEIVKECEHTLHNLNDIIAGYVTRMTITLQGDIQAGVNESKAYCRRVEASVKNQMDNLRSDVARRDRKLYDDMHKLYIDIDANNKKYNDDIRRRLAQQDREFSKRIAQLTAKVDKDTEDIKTDMKLLKSYVENDINALHDYVNDRFNEHEVQNAIDFGKVYDEISEIYNCMDRLQNVLLAIIANNRRYLDERIDMVNDSLIGMIENKADYVYVSNEVKRLEGLISEIDVNTSTVFNPVQEKVTGINEALKDIYNANTKVWSLTAGEYDSLNITAGAYDNLGLTAWEYDNLSRWFLLFKPKLLKHFHRDIRRAVKSFNEEITKLNEKMDECCNALNERIDELKNVDNDILKKLDYELNMYSPFTGMKQSIKDVINELAMHVRAGNALTAKEYDELNITAGDYDSKNITAYAYDWNSKNIDWS